MASLLLSTAGGALGAAFGPIGAMFGKLAGNALGSMVDGALFGGTRSVEGPRLKDLDVLSSTEGSPIPRLYGRMRLAGQVIWATSLEEVAVTQSQGGGKGGSKKSRNSQTTFQYYANFAVGICEGETAHLYRVWADGKPLDLANITYRFYKGDEGQMPDPLIVAKSTNAPAYRGLSYIVFERLPLENFGRRIPQLSFEIVKPVGSLEQDIKAVVMIPGSTEFGYSPSVLNRNLGLGTSVSETRHTFLAGSNFSASLDELTSLCPNLERISLVVSWFGTSLNLNDCEIKAGVEIADKVINEQQWQVSSTSRSQAHLISQFEGKSAYGGSPSDKSVIDAIRAIKLRGLKVTLYPFIMMDVPVDNQLTNPVTGVAPQPAYPWRGQMTCSQAVDNTSGVTTAVNNFFGTATLQDFNSAIDEVNYSGSEWSYTRFIYHYAKLVEVAGGVDAFIIGSEMIGASRMRSSSGVYPFVTKLSAIATTIKTLLPNTLLTYAADWTEYGAHVLNGAQEVRFPLDSLWANPAIGAVGIDYYAPLSDWRDGENLDEVCSIYDADYLKNGVTSGEAYDYYYASSQDRESQTRSAITDGAYNKPWIFRQKDLKSWWLNPHIERFNGVETTATAWLPQSKPIWITEFGVGAIDKATNQPSVFPDEKSSTAGVPYFSNKGRDDAIQRAGLSALIGAFNKPVNNPISPVYNGKMVTTDAIAIWAWDARPFPAFPLATSVWSDGANWQKGHWLNGRLGTAPLNDLVKVLAEDYGISHIEANALSITIDGYALDRAMTMREAIEPLAKLFMFNPYEQGETIVFKEICHHQLLAIDEENLVEDESKSPIKQKRGEAREVPNEVTLSFKNSLADYRVTSVHSKRIEADLQNGSKSEFAIATYSDMMAGQAEKLLHDKWASIETFSFALPPSFARVNVGDVLQLSVNDKSYKLLITAIDDDISRKIETRLLGALPTSRPQGGRDDLPYKPPSSDSPPHIEILELPHLYTSNTEVLSYIAVSANPFKGYVLSKSSSTSGFVGLATIDVPTRMGVVINSLSTAPPWIWDRENTLEVKLERGELASLPEEQVLGGENAIAVKNTGNQWEIIQFQQVELIAPKTYRLSMLLRGQAGTEGHIGEIAPNAPIVILDKFLTPLVEGIENYQRPSNYQLTAYGSVTGLSFTHTATNIALKPLAPVQLEAVRVSGGVRLSWKRRTRIDGDSFEAVDVPLGESNESYDLELIENNIIKHKVIVNYSSYLYTGAQELLDFGSLQNTVHFKVAQNSSSIGNGFWSEAEITL